MKGKLIICLVLLIGLANTINAANQETIKLYPTDDTKVDEFFPFNNYGASKSLEVRNGIGLFGGGWEINSLLKFDLSSIPKNATILSAELKLYYYKWKDTDPAGRELSLYEISGDWSEDNITWNNKPDYGDVKIASASVPSEEGKWMTWNVKDSVEGILKGKQSYGWVIKDEKAWGSTNIPYIFFYSKENANNKPYLSITYETAEEEKGKKGIPGWEIFILCTAVLVALSRKRK